MLLWTTKRNAVDHLGITVGVMNEFSNEKILVKNLAYSNPSLILSTFLCNLSTLKKRSWYPP